MSKVLLHIGTHKTASSYLQSYYFPAFKNVHYFHGEVALANLVRNCSPDENVLLSNESFSGLAWNALWKNGRQNEFHWIDSYDKCLDNLHQLFPEAQILIFFRKHGDFLVSMYKQYIQEGGILKLEDFYAEAGVVRKNDLNYTYRINKARGLFKRVYILSYEDYKKNGNNFLDKFFLNELGFMRSGASIKNITSNKSISGSKVELLRKINKAYNKLPFKLTNSLRLMRLSPRDILQNKLSFWSPEDADSLQKIKNEINAEMQNDWKYIEEIKWKYT